MIARSRVRAIVCMARQSNSLTELYELDDRIMAEGTDDPDGEIMLAIYARLGELDAYFID